MRLVIRTLIKLNIFLDIPHDIDTIRRLIANSVTLQ